MVGYSAVFYCCSDVCIETAVSLMYRLFTACTALGVVFDCTALGVILAGAALAVGFACTVLGVVLSQEKRVYLVVKCICSYHIMLALYVVIFT